MKFLLYFLAGRSAAWVPSERLFWIHGNFGAKLPTGAAERHEEHQDAEHIGHERRVSVTSCSFVEETRGLDYFQSASV
jgi:hypothetical protein